MTVPVTGDISIGAFVGGLGEIHEADFTIEIIYDYLRDNPVDPESLGPYRHFRKQGYTRNLVYRCDLFEILVICWDIGQKSTIHNHRDQKCWMTVPVGCLKGQNYKVRDRDDATKTCRLERSQGYLLDASRPGRVEVDEPVHQILNLPGYRQQAVSIHVYSRPYDSCEVYDLKAGTYGDVQLFYDTIEGRPVETAG